MACQLQQGRDLGSRTPRVTKADLIHGLGRCCSWPAGSRRRSWESIAALSSPQVCPLDPHGDREAWEGEGRLALPTQSVAKPSPFWALSIPVPQGRGASPVQDPMVLGLQPLRGTGHGPGVKGLELGFKCPLSQVLPSVGPEEQVRGQDQEREDGPG